MSAATPGLKVGPLDPDSTAEFGQVNGKTSARALVAAHMALHSQDLIRDLSRKHDEERSEALDMEEVASVAADNGIKGEVVGANVRGQRDRPQVLAITYLSPESKRSTKAVLKYDEDTVPESFAAGTEAVRIADAKEKGLPWIPAQVAQALGGGTGGGEVPDTSALAEQVKQLAERLDQADPGTELREQVADLRERLAAAENPEPYEGYAEDNVKEIKATVESEPAGLDRELLKRSIREAEQRREDPRQGVLDATEPVELVPADSTPEQG